MKVARTSVVAALVLGMIAIASPGGAAAGPSSGEAIFVANDNYVTAYPTDSQGDVSPIAITTDMTAPGGIARDASGRIYVTNSATNTVTVYAANATGNVPPIAVIGGSETQLSNPIGIALDPTGNIYVLNNIQGVFSGGEITVYPPLGIGTGILNEVPVAAIAGSQTQLDFPSAIAVDSRGDIYATNRFGGPDVPGPGYAPGIITVYSAGSNGNVAPIATINGTSTELTYPIGIALDSSGRIYVANNGTTVESNNGPLTFAPSITLYSAGSNGNAQPIATITGDNTGLSNPQDIALDSNLNLYTTNGDNNNVDIYSAGSNGDAFPAATIAGADTGLNVANAIALDSENNIYVLNSNGGPADNGSVTVYSAGSSGDTVPIDTITSSFTGLDAAYGIAVGSTGEVYVTNGLGGPDLSSVTIYPAGSYGTVSPVVTIAGEHTGLNSPSGIALDSGGNIAVLNNNSTITLFPAGSAGDVTPSATINIDRGRNNYPFGIAAGPNGKLYVANQPVPHCRRQHCYVTGLGNVAVYPAGSHGNAKPGTIISGPNTDLAFPSAIAVGNRGKIYVANQGAECPTSCGCSPSGHGSVTIYAPGSKGDTEPLTTIRGANTGLWFPYGIALDSNENIYVLAEDPSSVTIIGCFGSMKIPGRTPARGGAMSNGAIAGASGGSDPILVFAAGSHGDAAPIAIIGGPFTGLDGFGGIAIGPSGP